jgi:hypothetical protein
MANYTKRNERSAEIAREIREHARLPPTVTPQFACTVCGIEHGNGVPIWAVSTAISHTLYCSEHIPEEWRPSPEQIEQARQRA